MQFSSVILASMVAAMASAYSYVTVTGDDATYVETITEESDLSTPAGAYITYKVITGTKGTKTYTKTIWSTVYTSSSAEAETTTSTEAATSTAAEASSTAETTTAAETSTTAETTTAVETSEASSSAASSVASSAASSSAASSSASVSSYEGGAKNLGTAAGVVGFAGVAALLF